MITRDLTEFKCDACCATKMIHEESRYSDELPAGWLAPFHNSIGEDISFNFNGERVDIRLKGVCFCSAKCAADYLQKTLIVAIDNINAPGETIPAESEIKEATNG